MFVIFLVIAIPVFLVVSVNVFKILPRSTRNFCAYFTPLGFLLNLGVSSLILVFTGVAMVAGISNLAASMLFGIYLLMYREAHEIKGLEFNWKGPLGIKLLPIPKFIERNKVLRGWKAIIF